MHAIRVGATVTTAADGSVTAYIGTNAPLTGRLIDLQYVKTDYADTVDFTITSENTGRSLWSESNVTTSKVIAPRQPTHDQAAAASLYAAGGEPVEDHYVLVNDRIKIVLAQGGDTKVGTFYAVLA